MNALERHALRTTSRRLDPMLEPRETLLDFDTSGLSDSGPVDCIASTHAYYAVGRDGRVLRISYWDMVRMRAESTQIDIVTADGQTHVFRFRRPRKTFAGVVNAQAKAAFDEKSSLRDQGRLFEATWHRGRAWFTVTANGRIEARVFAQPSPDAMLDQEILEHAWSDLEVSLGRQPSFPHPTPAAAWIPKFDWDPPLPRATS